MPKQDVEQLHSVQDFEQISGRQVRHVGLRRGPMIQIWDASEFTSADRVWQIHTIERSCMSAGRAHMMLTHNR